MPDGTDDPRIYLAAERTFLAWIRTGLGLMGVGFAVARFGFFLRQFHENQPHADVHGTGISVYSGVALVALGVMVNVISALHHVRMTRALQSGTWVPGISRNALVLACLLAVLGITMGFYLLLLR